MGDFVSLFCLGRSLRWSFPGSIQNIPMISDMLFHEYGFNEKERRYLHVSDHC